MFSQFRANAQTSAHGINQPDAQTDAQSHAEALRPLVSVPPFPFSDGAAVECRQVEGEPVSVQNPRCSVKHEQVSGDPASVQNPKALDMH